MWKIGIMVSVYINYYGVQKQNKVKKIQNINLKANLKASQLNSLISLEIRFSYSSSNLQFCVQFIC